MTFLQKMAMESAAAVVRRWNPLPLGVQGVADFPSGSLVWTQLGYPVVVCAFRSLFVVRRLPRDNLMIMLLADSHPVGHDQICFSLGAQGMATVVSSPCLLPKVFDSSTSSATMPLFAPTGLTKACSLPSSLASIRRGSLLTPFFRRHIVDFPAGFWCLSFCRLWGSLLPHSTLLPTSIMAAPPCLA